MDVSPAFVSGICAALASVFGKLSGLGYDFLDYKLAYFLKILFFSVMVILNGVMWTFFVKALQASKSSLEATIFSSATNYIVSGLLGFLIFEEVTGVLWWTGIGFILIGLAIMKSSPESDKNE